MGSLDVIANVVHSDSSEVLDIIAEVQKLGLISDVTWSEEIRSMPSVINSHPKHTLLLAWVCGYFMSSRRS